MRILLIDDEPGVLENLVLYLEDAYHVVETLGWAEEERKLLEVLERFGPEGVILDFEMEPGGPEVFRWLTGWSSSIPIAFYTKYAKTQEKRSTMIALGVPESRIIQKQEIGRDVGLLLRALGG